MKEIQRGRIGGNFLGNIVLFMPVGFLLSIVTEWKKLWKTAVLGVNFSLFIEVIQLVTARGCVASDDVMLNTIGTLIGYGVYKPIKGFTTY